jgi:tetratricopeptide (TPR) repeat protein
MKLLTMPIVLLCLLLFSSLSNALDSQSSFETFFKDGITNYTNKDFEKAKTNFQQAYFLKPQDAHVLFNLAMSHQQLGQLGYGIAFLRMAQEIDPDYSAAKSQLKLMLEKIEIKELPHEASYWESFRQGFLLRWSFDRVLMLIAVSLATSGWLWLNYMKRRRESGSSKPLPIASLILTLFFFTGIIILGLKSYDSTYARGTIIINKASVFAGPNDQYPVLFELFEGLEVVIHNHENGWTQVTYPGGSTGWIQENTIIQTTAAIM